tara:strand:- start:62 stop:514 length:453 start_codon:yes stop_codon:yes gene_type:complete
MRSEVAQCATQIRKILKEKNIKASVRSEQFSMGNSVDVEIKEIIDPEVYKALQEELAKYKYGHFDGMYDIYEHSNLREDIPQTKYLFIKYDWRLQDEALEKLEEFVKGKVNLGVSNNPDHEYKRLAGDLLFGRDDWMEWEKVKHLANLEA